MAKIDFYISNDRHHVANVLPLVERLRGDHDCRVVSLCELRGIATPGLRLEAAGARVERVMPPGLRSSSGAPAKGGATEGPVRRLARAAVWQLLLARPLARAVGRADLAVLPNDAAYPYDRLARRLRAGGAPFVLLQEGIRFPLPGVAPRAAYGAGGATAVAAWGETSAEYFRRVGVPEDRVALTGCPRFDGLRDADWRAAVDVLRRDLPPERKRLLLVTNPIDHQGLASTRHKLALARRLVDAAEALARGELEIVIKLHGGEAEAGYREALAGIGFPNRVRFSAAPLHALFGVTDAAVVMASTAGLEALLFGLPLGVLEIPGRGFVYDYVRAGAAVGLPWREPMAGSLERLLGGTDRPGVERFLEASFATREDAGTRVAELLRRLTEPTDG